MESVKLLNGSEEADVLVTVVMMSLKSLWNEGLAGVLAVYDLHQLCQNPNYSAMYIKHLNSLNLVSDDGSVHDSIRNVVMSAVQGEGLEMTLRSPIAE